MLRRAVAAVVVAVGLVVPFAPAGADPVPPTDAASPYVGAFDAQIPSGDPWAPPRNSGEAATRDTFRKEYASGIRWTYTWVPWSSIEKSPGTYDFTDLDNYLTWARAEGILVRLQVMTGDWSRPQPWVGALRMNAAHSGVNVPAVDLQPAVDFWAALVARYMPGGTLADEKGWTDGYGVTRWEFENEPACIAWWGSWGRVPKDFAEFVQRVSDRVRVIDPQIKLSGPALSQNDNDATNQCATGGLDGLPWLAEALDAQESEWESTTYAAAATHQAVGPYLDAFSWHFDNARLDDGSVPARAQALRSLVDSYATAPAYPTTAGTPLWYSEGSALSYNTDNAKFATAQVQLMAQLLGAGVQTMNLEPGTQLGDGWESTPMYGAQRALTTYLPRAGEVVPADADIDPTRVTAYLRTDASSGARTYVFWAKDLPQGSVAGPGPDFSVQVPVRTSTADVLTSSDWSAQVTTAANGFVTVTVHADDPSPVVIVAER